MSFFDRPVEDSVDRLFDHNSDGLIDLFEEMNVNEFLFGNDESPNYFDDED